MAIKVPVDDNTRGTVRFFDNLVRCETRLYNAVGEQLRAQHGLAAVEFELLEYLKAHPSARVGEIATNFAAGVGAISKLTDRMVARQLVRRRPNPADGRSSLIELTRPGESLATDAQSTFHRRVAELVCSCLPAGRVDAVAEALAILRTALERDHVGVPAG